MSRPNSRSSYIISDASKLNCWATAIFNIFVYPRSVKDSDGDVVARIRGIIEDLVYLVELGLDGVWLSPIFKGTFLLFDYYSFPDNQTLKNVDRLLFTSQKMKKKFLALTDAINDKKMT